MAYQRGIGIPRNMIDQQEELKRWPDDRLITEMQEPSGTAPQFLVFTEVNRRKDMRERYQEDMARQDRPKMSIHQNTTQYMK